MTNLPTPDDALAYATDAVQRAMLFMDVMRQRSEQAAAHNAETVPHVLSFEADLVCDGRKLPRPVNYFLVRILPLKGMVNDKD